MSETIATAYQKLVKQGDIDPDSEQEQIVMKLQKLSDELISALSRPPSSLFGIGSRQSSAPKGLYLYGGVGRGKSMLMDLFHDHIAIKQKLRVHFHEFMQDVHEKIHAWRQASREGKVKGDEPISAVGRDIIKGVKLLCFDEFHVTDITDAMILGRLFDVFYGEGVVIIATSNRHPDDLYENGLNRQLFLPFISRLKENMDVLPLDGVRDYRLERITGTEIYHTPLGDKADIAMQAAWERLTNHKTGEPEFLHVKGRELRVPQALMGVARFDFADLCDQALGAADYLKIAHHYHTILLANIPQLGAEHRNQAKRFVTLVDALYESKVKLIVSSAVEADKIYQEGDGQFEFARTASRLHEMRSEDYLALGHGT